MSILGENLSNHICEASKKVERIVSHASFDVPKFDGAEEESLATNSLDANCISSLENGEHLQESYLREYYSELEAC